jgi:hypothetical protein
MNIRSKLIVSGLSILLTHAQPSWASPEGPANGGGGEVERSGQRRIEESLSNDQIGFLAFLLRMETFVAPGMTNEHERAFAQVYASSEGNYPSYSVWGPVYKALQTMFYSKPELNPVDAIKNGRIKIKVINADCIHNGEAKDGSAKPVFLRDGTQKFGEGEICISAKRLGQLAPNGVVAEVFPLVLHEIGHLYGLNEASAQALQKIARSRASHLIGSWGYKASVFDETRTRVRLILPKVELARTALERFKRDIDENRLDAGEVSNVSAYVYGNITFAQHEFQMLQRLWRTASSNETASYIGILPFEVVFASGGFGLPGDIDFRWFPMTPQYLSFYENVLVRLEAAAKKLREASDSFIVGYEKRAYGDKLGWLPPAE